MKKIKKATGKASKHKKVTKAAKVEKKFDVEAYCHEVHETMSKNGLAHIVAFVPALDSNASMAFNGSKSHLEVLLDMINRDFKKHVLGGEINKDMTLDEIGEFLTKMSNKAKEAHTN